MTEFDRDGKKKSTIFSKGDDWSISSIYNSSGNVDEMTVESKNGTAKLKNDRDIGKFFGEGIRKDGETSGVYVSQGRLVYPYEKSDSNHAKVLVLPESLDDLAKPIEGEYNEDLRTVTTTQHGHKQVESVDSGRIDIYEPRWQHPGKTANGEKSTIKPSGEAWWSTATQPYALTAITPLTAGVKAMPSLPGTKPSAGRRKLSLTKTGLSSTCVIWRNSQTLQRR